MKIDFVGGGEALPKPKAIVRGMARQWIDDLDAIAPGRAGT